MKIQQIQLRKFLCKRKNKASCPCPRADGSLKTISVVLLDHFQAISNNRDIAL